MARISGLEKPEIPISSRASPSLSEPGTETIAGEGRILTAGGNRCPYPFHCSAADRRSARGGTTTLVGGGTGPAIGTMATTCTPGPWYIRRMLEAVEELPINFGLIGKGNASLPEPLHEQIAQALWL